MPRILGVDIPTNKKTYISLQYLYGIGQAQAIKICFDLGIDPQVRASELNEDEVSQITKHLEANYTVEGALRRSITSDITRLRDIQSYRGIRHRRSLPCRGQRTRTNARTRKGVKKTVAGKKGVKDMKH
jgi:small subunit ribosomal protein S13